MKRDAFLAIADPTRREIINMIAFHSLNVNTVASHFKVSRTAIYKHLKILSQCGLVQINQQGRERICEAKLEKLQDVSDWIEPYQKVWATRLDSLDNYLHRLQSQNEKIPEQVKKKKPVKKT
jgi:DNA-binding transcriptional ArsR family regulator